VDPCRVLSDLSCAFPWVSPTATFGPPLQGAGGMPRVTEQLRRTGILTVLLTKRHTPVKNSIKNGKDEP
jgi:hypothetical protein